MAKLWLRNKKKELSLIRTLKRKVLVPVLSDAVMYHLKRCCSPCNSPLGPIG
jgi:hypothetical protein